MANYNSTHTGSQIDSAIDRAKSGGALDTRIDGKQNTLTSTQRSAVNSGITAEKVTTYDGYASTIAGKQDALPTIVNDKYLHTNALTGALEWKTGTARGTDDFDDLINKPEINGVILQGDKSSADLGVQEELTETQLEAVNSGVNETWKQGVDSDISALEVGKQDTLTTAQQKAVDSGITSTDVARMLKVPMTTPTEKLITGVDANNSQVMFKAGTGIQFTGDTSPYSIEATGGGGSVNDVQLNSTSIVDANGVANIPVGNGQLGVMQTDSSTGTTMSTSGILRALTKTYSEYQTDVAGSGYMFIGSKTLDNVITGADLQSGTQVEAKCNGMFSLSGTELTITTY